MESLFLNREFTFDTKLETFPCCPVMDVQKNFEGHIYFKTETRFEQNKFSLSIFFCSLRAKLFKNGIYMAFVSENLYKLDN